MWERLYVHGTDIALLLPSAEAQVTLAAYANDVPTDRIDAALGRLSGSWAAMQIGITGIGIFGGVSAALWLAVAPTAALVGVHSDLHTALGDLPCLPRYLPGRWTPGIAVSEHAVSVADALRLLLPMLTEPIFGTLVALELVDQQSGTIISSIELRSGPGRRFRLSDVGRVVRNQFASRRRGADV
jgi:hypothetical protein